MKTLKKLVYPLEHLRGPPPSLQLKPELDRTKPSTGPHVGCGLDRAALDDLRYMF